MTSKTFSAMLICLAISLCVYAQFYAYVGDEATHLVAAQLIVKGERPCVDFFSPHPPLWPYLLAGAFLLFGETWRVAHVLSALFLAGSMWFAAMTARSLFVEESAKWLAAASAAMLIGANAFAVIFATTALPYGFCLFGMTAGVYFTLSKRYFLAGLLAGAPVSAYLLTLPVLVVLFAWVLWRDRTRAPAFIAGVLVASLPALVLFIPAPRETFGRLIEFYFGDRPDLGWRYNARSVVVWFGTLQGLLLIVPALAALYFRKDEGLRLCGWVAAALCAVIAASRSVDALYWTLALPFWAILAASGLIEIARRLNRSALVAAIVVALYAGGGVYQARYIWRWEAPHTDYVQVRRIADDLTAHTPENGAFYAFDAAYFEARRLPPPTLENRFNPRSEALAMLRQGRFNAVFIFTSDPKVEQAGLFDLYQENHLTDLNGVPAYYFWGLKSASNQLKRFQWKGLCEQ